MTRRPLRFVAQSAMEYLMTYGWAILIIAVVLAALFELGVFNGSNLAPQACIAEAGFVCRNPVYTSNGIALTLGQTTGRTYYDVWVFISSQGEALNSSGIPVNFSTANAIGVGFGPNNALSPGQTFLVNFPHTDFPHGAIPSNPPIGTQFAGYVWLGYCLSPCSGPTAYSKVATITIKSTAGFAGPTTTSITVTTTTTTTTTTSIATTTIHYVNITLDSTGGSASAGFQQMLQFNPSSYTSYEAPDLGNLRFYQGNSELYSWCESNCTSGSSLATFWVKTNGLASGTTANAITMYFEPSGNSYEYSGPSGHAGEAPQLSTPYAQYDNGASIFGFYDNFYGSSINAGYTAVTQGGMSITQNNGLIISTSYAPYGGLIWNTGLNPPFVFDVDVTSVSGVAAGIALQTGNSDTSGSIDFNYWGGSVACGVMAPPGMYSNNNPNLQISTGIMGGTWYSPSSQIWYKNYVATSGSENCYSGSWSPQYLAYGIYDYSQYSSIALQWARTRAFPPNGVMPSASFGSMQ